jgi:hypothetical protein
VALLAGSAGVTGLVALLVKQLFGFAKFVMKRRSLQDVMKRTSRSPDDWLTAARALQMLDGGTAVEKESEKETGKPADRQPPPLPPAPDRPANVEQLRPQSPDPGSSEYRESG